MRKSLVPSVLLKQKRLSEQQGKENASPEIKHAPAATAHVDDAECCQKDAEDPVKAPAAKKFKPLVVKPANSKPAAAAPQNSTQRAEDAKRYYSVMWTSDPPTKKHKSWCVSCCPLLGQRGRARFSNVTAQDGILVCSSNTSEILSMEGKSLAKQLGRAPALSDGQTWRVGRKECEIISRIEDERFISGAVFLNVACGDASSSSSAGNAPPRAQPEKHSQFKPPAAKPSARAAAPAAARGPSSSSSAAPPRHDPSAPNALVLNSSELAGPGPPATPVVVDPILSNHLRPHQREGVQFLYDCVTGRRTGEPSGCILADEMGLGKTLQAIALIWTLLKQGPRGTPLAKKAVVVAPASLVQNWAKEVKRWLGNERLHPVVAASSPDAKASDLLKEFELAQHRPLLLISYELYKKHRDRINGLKSIGLLVCDEGHRLKNAAGNDTTAALAGIPTPRRVILSGTPIQNALDEYYAMLSFCCPGALGSLASFKRCFADAIKRGRDPGASPEEQAIAEERTAQLGRTTAAFLLRRTAQTLQRYLPPRHEHTVFCRLSPLQERLYRHFLSSRAVRGLTPGRYAEVLTYINALRKLCNSPRLVHGDVDAREEGEEGSGGSASGFADAGGIFEEEGYDPSAAHQPGISGKLDVLEALLAHARAQPQPEKLVIVSNFTRTLDVIQAAVAGAGYSFARLDGSTDVAKRQDLVDRFNSPAGPAVFLLSSKAGGVGLNLIGGSRLVLFDPDWNPAHDLQAMARVWRDGQARPVHIYRLLATGSIEERIFQRQISKLELSDAVVDERDAVRHFSPDDIKRLFTLQAGTDSDTRDLLQASSPEWAGDGRRWEERVEDGLLKAAAAGLADRCGGRGAVSHVHTRAGAPRRPRRLRRAAVSAGDEDEGDGDEGEAEWEAGDDRA
eukprot:tig00000605_g2468.t1